MSASLPVTTSARSCAAVWATTAAAMSAEPARPSSLASCVRLLLSEAPDLTAAQQAAQLNLRCGAADLRDNRRGHDRH
jgi:hypothetical protein